jgi:2-C-methyl-D-erythritol 4-phosphate cytidylyltransferase
VDTAFLNLNGRPVVSYSLSAFEECSDIDGVAVVAPKERMTEVQRVVQLFGCTKVRRIAAGTTQRLTSLKAALDCLDDDVTILAIHQVSRPCVTSTLISETIKTAKRYDCGIAAARMMEPVRVVPKGHKIVETLDAGTAWSSQTPIACRLELLQKALKADQKRKSSVQDEAHAIERLKKTVHVVSAPTTNIRINGADDLALAEAIMRVQ